MYNLIKADEIYKKRVEKNPQYDHELVVEWRNDMPQQFAKKMYEDEYGCHIVIEDMYEEAICLLSWSNEKGSGARWDANEIIKLSEIDFSTKNYYEYDYAYVVNMLYSDFCHIFTDAGYYLKMAKAYLEDRDYTGDPSERAYKDATKRIKYFKQK